MSARAAAAVVAGGVVIAGTAWAFSRRSSSSSTPALGAGYVDGRPVAIALAPISDGKFMRKDAAAAYNAMAAAAKASGRTLTAARAFATIDQQRRLYAAHLGAEARRGVKTAAQSFAQLQAEAPPQERQALVAVYAEGKGNLAARPGFSNHQGGIAVDIEVGGSTSSPVYQWLKANARRFGFRRTVPSEPWHWEYRPAEAGRPDTLAGLAVRRARRQPGSR